MGNLSNIFSVQALKLSIDILGGLSILFGFVFLVIFSLTSDRRFIVRTAARYRAPNQLSYSRDILKRQMDDWHRALGATLILASGFLLLTVSYRIF